MVAGAVRAVDDDAQPAQVQFRRKRTFAELDVPPRRVVDAARLAELRRCDAFERRIHACLDRGFDVVRQLGSRGGKELDAVVVERIVRRADHDARG